MKVSQALYRLLLVGWCVPAPVTATLEDQVCQYRDMLEECLCLILVWPVCLKSSLARNKIANKGTHCSPDRVLIHADQLDSSTCFLSLVAAGHSCQRCNMTSINPKPALTVQCRNLEKSESLSHAAI